MPDDDIVLGIDIGGSGIKAAPVRLATGELLAARERIPTPVPAEPGAVSAVVAELVGRFAASHPFRTVGCTFPGVVKLGHTLTAANLEPSWVGLDAATLLAERSGQPIVLMNDADAAGLAEMRFGAGRGRTDVVIMLTLGTGIGSALFHDGALVPNTELGHMEMRRKAAEARAAARVREEKHLSWREYATVLNEYLALVERILWPDLIIIGGGVSARADRWLDLLHTRAELAPAVLANNAGIVGAALWTTQRPTRASAGGEEPGRYG